MKKVKLLFLLTFIFIVTLITCTISNALVYNPDLKFKEEAGMAYMKYATPKIDGDITSHEGWGNGLQLNEDNLMPTMNDFYYSCPTAKVRFAYDEQYFYVCANVTDDDFIYCTGESTEDPPIFINDYPKKTNVYGYDGDEIALCLDPLRKMELNGQTLAKDMCAWYCFGLFEDGHVGVYRTFFGTKELNNEVIANGKKTSSGWCFEAAIPWETVKETVYCTSYGMVDFDYTETVQNGALTRASVNIIDRILSPESEEVQCDNIFSTLRKFTASGIKSSHYRTPGLGNFGIDLIPSRDGYTYKEPAKRTSLEWTNTFNDVKENKWYYKGISYACNNEWFAGTSGNTFSPSLNMSRAMAVTILAKMARYDGTDVIDDLYEDVPSGKWYSKAVTWSYKRDIANGISETEFGPNNDITREEFALLMLKLAQFKKYRIDDIDDNVLDSFPDASDISSWAKEGMKFAVKLGLISGQKTDDGVFLSPKATITRAECATILKAFDSAPFSRFAKDGEYADITINGNDISNYCIIIGTEIQDFKSALELQKYINQTSNKTINIYRDTNRKNGIYEILIGKTNRENENNVINRDCVSTEGYTIVTKDSKLYITGGENNGTLYGTYTFIEDYLGWVFSDNTESRYYNKTIEINDINLTQNSMLDNLEFFDSIDSSLREKYKLCGGRDWADDGHQCGIQYLIDENYDYYGIHNPCYSDEDFIATVIQKLKVLIENKPKQKIFSLGVYDSHYYCMCEKCVQAAYEEGSRGGSYFRLVNRVAAYVKEHYPDVKIYILGYNHTIDPPKLEFCDNIMFRFINIAECIHHSIDDENCMLNKPLHDKMLKWTEKVDNVWTGDHGLSFEHYLCPNMNQEFIYRTIKFYKSINSKGFFYWGITVESGDYQMLRNYLMAKMFWNPEMNRDEYQILIEEFLETKYGDSWPEMLKYIDAMTAIQKDVDSSQRATATGSINVEMFVNSEKYLTSIWNTALEKAKNNDVIYSNTEKAMTQYIYIKQAATWDAYYNNGTQEQKDEYTEQSQLLYDLVIKYNIAWSDTTTRPNTLNYKLSPEYWSY